MILRRLIGMGLFLGVGFVLGNAASTRGLASLWSQDLPPGAVTVRCATDLSTQGWQEYHSEHLGYTLRYPSSFTLQETNGVLLFSNSAGEQISLQKMHDALAAHLDPAMEQGSWKIANRRTYALTRPYYTADDGTLQSSYLFVKDFPQNGVAGNYTIVKADITLSRNLEKYKKVLAQGIVDPEMVLNEPEQVLSTFRFLESDEMESEKSSYTAVE